MRSDGRRGGWALTVGGSAASLETDPTPLLVGRLIGLLSGSAQPVRTLFTDWRAPSHALAARSTGGWARAQALGYFFLPVYFEQSGFHVSVPGGTGHALANVLAG